MRTKNNIILKTHGGMFSGNGLHRTAIHRNLRDSLHNVKAESSVNNAVFGKVLGVKKDADNAKIGSIGSGEYKHVPFIKTGGNEDIAEALKKISFKEKKARNNISLQI